MAAAWLFHVNALPIILGAAAFFVLRKFKWNPIAVMLACGVVGLKYAHVAVIV